MKKEKLIWWETNCERQFVCGDRSRQRHGSIEPWLPEPMPQLSLLSSSLCQMLVNSAMSCTLFRFHTHIVLLLNTALLEEVWTRSTRMINTSTTASPSVRAACKPFSVRSYFIEKDYHTTILTKSAWICNLLNKLVRHNISHTQNSPLNRFLHQLILWVCLADVY